MKFELQVIGISIEPGVGTTITVLNPNVKVKLFQQPKTLTIFSFSVVIVDLYNFIELEVNRDTMVITLSTGGVDYGEVKVL